MFQRRQFTGANRPGFRRVGWVAALLVVMSLLEGGAAHALARSSQYAASPGSVTCSFFGLVKFSPRLTSSGGGTGKSNVSLTLPKSDCQSDYARFVAGRFKGSFTQSPLSCATLSATGAQMVGTANWSTGFHNGLNFVRWSPSTVNGTVVNGSFAGSASLRVNVPASWASACASPAGVRSTRITGTFTWGPVCPPGEDPVTSGPVTIYTISGASLCATGVNAQYLARSITSGPDGALWFTLGDNSIGRISTAGAVTLYRDLGIDGPTDITAGPDGALWFTNTETGVIGHPPSIGRITTSGSVSDYTATGISDPSGITVGPDGALWFTQGGTSQVGSTVTYGSIGRITTSGSVTIYTGSAIDSPSSITAGPDGALWFTNDGHRPKADQPEIVGQSIGRITTNGTMTDFTDPSLDIPEAINSGPEGALWFVNGASGSCSIGSITTSGSVTSFPYGCVDGTGFTDVTPGPDGALWFTSAGFQSAIGRMPLSGTTTFYSVPSVLNVPSPNAITTGSDGALWFVDLNGTIGRVTTP